MNLYVVYEITNFPDINSYPMLPNALFGAAQLTKNADIDKYRYFEYGISDISRQNLGVVVLEKQVGVWELVVL